MCHSFKNLAVLGWNAIRSAARKAAPLMQAVDLRDPEGDCWAGGLADLAGLPRRSRGRVDGRAYDARVLAADVHCQAVPLDAVERRRGNDRVAAELQTRVVAAKQSPRHAGVVVVVGEVGLRRRDRRADIS